MSYPASHRQSPLFAKYPRPRSGEQPKEWATMSDTKQLEERIRLALAEYVDAHKTADRPAVRHELETCAARSINAVMRTASKACQEKIRKRGMCVS